MVKKEKFSEYFKSKGFYISLLAGVAAIAAITLICYGFGVINQKDDLPDLNEPLAQKEADLNNAENNMDSARNETIVPQAGAELLEEAQAQPPKISGGAAAEIGSAVVTEEDISRRDAFVAEPDNYYPETEEAGQEAAEPAEAVETAEDIEDTVPVMLPEGRKISDLSFNEETGLLWPVAGNVIMNYSMDRGIYFKTLGQYKCNPAILIESEVGTEVISAANAVVTQVLQNEETGLTVRTEIGNEYEVIYGQLKDVEVKEGDTLEEGALIGYIEEPTKYYVAEGSNLYLQVIQKEESVNPLLLLR